MSPEQTDTINNRPLRRSSFESERNITSSGGASPKRSGFRLQKPVIIAAVILAVTAVIFAFWGTFFCNTLENKIWVLHFTVEGKEHQIGFRFGEENECLLYNGGFVNNGRYSITKGLNGKETLSIELTEYGQPLISNNFNYEITGNIFSGRNLTLTDLSGENLIRSITGIDKDSADLVCDYTEENGKKYYKYTLSAEDRFETEYDRYPDGKTDSELSGTWYCKMDDSVYDHTYTFNDDGTLTIKFRDFTINGCYTAENGSGKFNAVFGNGSVSNNKMTYEIKDGVLTLTMNDVPEKCTKTDGSDVFESEVR